MLPLKEKMKYIGIIAFLLFGLALCLFGGIYLLIKLPVSFYVMVGTFLCLVGASVTGVLAFAMWKEYKYHMHNNN